jgi:hypothetical protein
VALLFIEGYEIRGVIFMSISGFGFWRTWRMWKGDRLSPFIRNLPIFVALPALGVFLVVSGISDLLHDRSCDGYTRLGGALLAAGVSVFVLLRSMRERSSEQLAQTDGSTDRHSDDS